MTLASIHARLWLFFILMVGIYQFKALIIVDLSLNQCFSVFSVLCQKFFGYMKVSFMASKLGLL